MTPEITKDGPWPAVTLQTTTGHLAVAPGLQAGRIVAAEVCIQERGSPASVSRLDASIARRVARVLEALADAMEGRDEM